MSRSITPTLVSKDAGLLKHWRDALGIEFTRELHSFFALQQASHACESVVWLDMSTGDVPPWTSQVWSELLRVKQLRVIAASSYPKDADAIAALDQGCAGYCHAFSDPETLRQVQQVTSAGHVWIGQHLMQQLIQTANRTIPTMPASTNAWDENLTTREREVAKLAAYGASNMAIAGRCDITERTVKAHLSAVFDKLGVTDRLQLALKVHGIQ